MARLKKLRHHLFVCVHKTCVKQGAKNSAKEFKTALRERDLRDRVMVTKSDCLDQCGRGPVVIVYPDGIWYKKVDADCARRIVVEHLEGGEIVVNHVLHRVDETS